MKMKIAGKLILLVSAISMLSACNTVYNMPAGRSEQNFYQDLNECKAVEMRINAGDSSITRNCMFGKGYTIQR